MKEVKVQPECFPCFLRQVLLAIDQHNLDYNFRIEVMKASIKEVLLADVSRTPAYASTFIHKKVRQMLGYDPFLNKKNKYNQIASDLYSRLKKIVSKSNDPLRTAMRLAIAGNVIDFGIFKEIDIELEIKKALNDNMGWEDYYELINALHQTDELLYLLDNAGEIVFDKLLIDTLQFTGKKITAVVKGGPIINDATMEDATQIGLHNTCQVIDNGSDAIGTIIEWCSEDFKKRFLQSSLIISKGQGNFETLSTSDKNIFFLFQAKCDVVAEYIGVKKGDRLLISSKKLRQYKNGVF